MVFQLRNFVCLLFVCGIFFGAAKPVAGQLHRRGHHIRANYIVGSFAPVAPVYRPGNFTRMIADGYRVGPTVVGLPYFPRNGIPGFFQSYFRLSPFYPVVPEVVVTVNAKVPPAAPLGLGKTSRLDVERSTRTVLSHDVSPLRKELRTRDMLELESPRSGARIDTASGNLISTKYDAAEYQRLAEKEFRNGNFSEAAKHINHSLIEDNENGKLLLFAAHASLAQGEYNLAVNQLESATQLLHQNDWNFIIRNRFEAFDRVNYQTGIAALGEYLSRNPNSVDALILRGFHLGCAGLLEDAQIDLLTALSLHPQHVVAQRLLGALKLPTTVATPLRHDFHETNPVEVPLITPIAPNPIHPPVYTEPEVLPSPKVIEEELIEGELVDPVNDQDWLDLEPSIEPKLESVLELNGG